MISLTFRCAECSWSRYGSTTATILEAQDHCNETAHRVNVQGHVSRISSLPQIQLDNEAISDSARAKARELAILRIAQQRGLLDKAKLRFTK